jgi:hypothetical protein
MKQISDEQIKGIIQAFYDLNAPVKLFEGVRKLLEELPPVEKSKDKEPKKVV